MAVVAGLTFVKQASAQDDQVHLYVEDGTKALPELIRHLDSEGIAIATISLSEPSLDDVFLAKTGRSLRDAEPATHAKVAAA